MGGRLVPENELMRLEMSGRGEAENGCEGPSVSVSGQSGWAGLRSGLSL